MSTKPMDTRELDQQVKSLVKAMQEKEPVANALAIISKLSQEKPTEDMLRATRAGVIVAKLRGHSNRQIATAATECVNKWKSVVNSTKAKKTEVRAKASSAGSSSAPSPAPIKALAAGSINAPFKGDVEKRRFDADGAVINVTQCEVRNRCVGLMYNGLAYRSKESIARVTEVAAKVEAAIYQHHGNNSASADYKARVRSLFQNLKNKNNPELGRNIMSGAITPEAFARMSAEDMKSSTQREKERKLEEENMKRAQAPIEEKSVSDAWKCSKCGERKTSYTQAQTRAADEPMTTFCECMGCGHRWKFS